MPHYSPVPDTAPRWLSIALEDRDLRRVSVLPWLGLLMGGHGGDRREIGYARLAFFALSLESGGK
jgi:hypothetical protein